MWIINHSFSPLSSPRANSYFHPKHLVIHLIIWTPVSRTLGQQELWRKERMVSVRRKKIQEAWKQIRSNVELAFGLFPGPCASMILPAARSLWWSGAEGREESQKETVSVRRIKDDAYTEFIWNRETLHFARIILTDKSSISNILLFSLADDLNKPFPLLFVRPTGNSGDGRQALLSFISSLLLMFPFHSVFDLGLYGEVAQTYVLACLFDGGFD